MRFSLTSDFASDFEGKLIWIWNSIASQSTTQSEDKIQTFSEIQGVRKFNIQAWSMKKSLKKMSHWNQIIQKTVSEI